MKAHVFIAIALASSIGVLCSCTAMPQGEQSAGDRKPIEAPAGVAVPALAGVF